MRPSSHMLTRSPSTVSGLSEPLTDIAPSVNEPLIESGAEPGTMATTSYVYTLPEFPLFLRKFDDAIITALQNISSNVFVVGFCLFWTIITAIELAVAAPFILSVLGYDVLGQFTTYTAFTLALVSQLPKRFLWRTRPYLAGRARRVRADKTSSFPSRAVTCATVYSLALSLAYNHHTHAPSLYQVEWWMPLFVLFCILCTSFARIWFGVHYPTDCLGGVIQGVIVIFLGVGLYEASVSVCRSCRDDKCYTLSDPLSSFGEVDWMLVCGLSLVWGFLTLLSTTRPFLFWEKCQMIFGLLFSCVTFQVSMLCEPLAGSSLSAPKTPKPFHFLIAAVLPAVSIVVGLKSKGSSRAKALAVFFLTFFSAFFSLALIRLS
eukprot:TRINITY_DN3515_c0_g1_i1.p1 TRINITY_DN3515_c0_g1~~TRINITY_DN3515_c0_g1_i1.p1  ORF type:complete len:376 (-),score=91.33 TRINITY_DN3515_c0_g1_i1:32-1159(-)